MKSGRLACRQAAMSKRILYLARLREAIASADVGTSPKAGGNLTLSLGSINPLKPNLPHASVRWCENIGELPKTNGHLKGWLG
ncbi:MAG: hypothetical protein ACUVWO_11455 [Thermodesulfobacteriota bacterium]